MTTSDPAANLERRLAALSDYGILDTPAEAGFEDIVFVASHVCDVPIALISLVDRDRQWFKARLGFEACETPLDQSICAHALGSTSLLVIPDLTVDPRTRDNPLVTGETAIRFYTGAPLIVSGGIVIGTLCVIDTVARPAGLSEAQAKVLEALARQIVRQLEFRKLQAERETALARQMRTGIASLAEAIAISEDENASLRASDLRSVEAQEAGGVGLMEIDVATDMITASAELCRIFGLPVAPTYPASDIERLVLAEDDAIRSDAAARRSGAMPLEVEYRVRRADDGHVRWVGRRARFVRDGAGNVVKMIGTVQDVTERRRLQDHQLALLELGDRLRDLDDRKAIATAAGHVLGRTLAANAAGYGTLSGDGTVLTVLGAWAAGDGATLHGDYPVGAGALGTAFREGRDVIVADSEDDATTADSLETLRAVGARSLIGLPIMHQGRWVALIYVNDTVPRSWGRDEIVLARAVADRTQLALDKVRAEAEQRVLNQELSHRLKNTLAMVQAIATQTLRHVADREPIAAFEKRIHALGTAHDVLLQESWSSASLKSVVEAVLSTFGQPARFQVSGTDITLGPRATMSLSLLLHELGTNAFKYGALTAESGIVEVTWREDDVGTGRGVVFSWIEKGGPPVVEPTRKGFGSRLIQMGLVGTGGVSLRYLAAGFRADMIAPMSQLQQS